MRVIKCIGWGLACLYLGFCIFTYVIDYIFQLLSYLKFFF